MFKYFSNIYNLYWKHKIYYTKKQYSCFGEDIFIKDYFKNDKEGFYVDVGSYHSVFFGITHIYFIKKSGME